MTQLTLTNTLTAGTPENVNQVQQNFTDVTTWANANVDQDNMTSTFLDKIGVTKSGTVRRGETHVAGAETRTNAAYGSLTTPDQVSSVVLPSNGLIVVGYQAIWQNSTAGNGRAAIFIGANQLKAASATGAAAVQEALGSATINDDDPLATTSLGLATSAGAGAATEVTTGQVLGTASFGGPTYVFASAGTYTISVQFKSAAGSVTVKNRHLWVWTMGF